MTLKLYFLIPVNLKHTEIFSLKTSVELTRKESNDLL